MGFEVVGALVIWFAIAIGVRLYLRYFGRDIETDAAFEEWCRSRPRVAYLAVRPAEAHLARRALPEALDGASTVVVSEGVRPWPHYAFELEVERLSGDVLALVISAVRPRAGRRSRGVELRHLVEQAAAAAPTAFVELWLHGQLHQRRQGSRIDRDRIGWIARAGAGAGEGELTWEQMLGTPSWAQPQTRAA